MNNHPLNFEIDSRDSFVLAFRDWRARYPLPCRQVAALLGVSLLRVHLYETGYFKFDQARETAVFQRMRSHGGHSERAVTAQEVHTAVTANHGDHGG